MSWMFPFFRFDQPISPVTTWFPTTVNYQGDPTIERKVVEEIASVGKQLGIISDALLEVADGRTGEGQLARLRKIVAKVNDLKARRRKSLAEETTDSFKALAKEAPD